MSEHVETPQEEHVVHEFFLGSVIIKGFISVAEVIAAGVVLLVPPAFLVSSTLTILAYLPNAKLQNALMQEVAHFTAGTALFVSFYLLSRGLVKTGLVWGLLKGKLVAYPLSLVILAFLVLYQVYQIATTHSLIVLGITLFDLVVIYFVYREWRIVLRHRAGTSARGTETPEDRD